VATNSNFIVKVTNAKLPDVQKALQQAGIKVRSIIEVFKEETKGENSEKTEEAK
jgi:ribosomal protein L11